MALHVGPFREVGKEAATPLGSVVADPAHATIQRPLARLLGPDSNAGTALRWSQTETRDDSLLVPLADARTGTHIEAVAGECVLADLPPPEPPEPSG